MTRSELEKLLSDVRSARIGVLGDFCLDAYWHLDPTLSEPSIETGLPTRAVRTQGYSLGGAGNVVANLAAMGVDALSAFGVIGDDPFGREMLRILGSLGVDVHGMLSQQGQWSTPVYVKPVEGDSEQNRIDFGNANLLDAGVRDALLEAVRRGQPSLDLLIINQQLLHGIHTPELRAALPALIESSHAIFICDSRSFSDSYHGAIRKINDREALRLCGREWDPEDPVPRAEVEKAARELFERWLAPVFVTRGARGILVCEGRAIKDVPGLQILGRIDTVGAGDTALAGISAALASGHDAREAATLGNLAAGVTVQKLFQTGTASPGEIIAIGTDPDFVYQPELAENPRKARFHGSSEIEIVTGLPAARSLTHAIFDHDGTISTLREGWESIMEPVMIRAILGPGFKNAEERLYQRARERVRDFIDRTTGVQTLVQMQGLVEMVREFAVVPASEVLDEHGYKKLYNKELLAMVKQRADKLSRKELSAEDFTLKGAVPFLEALARRGVKLYLASGTDQEDIVAEAGVLGYADLFGGRMYGSVGDVRIEAKKVVLEKILQEIAGNGRSPEALGGLLTFGDGPVEIRETKKRGGFTVGVASDEPRRYGWNHKKRTRLIRAGADLVVPDFSQWQKLLGLLGGAGGAQ